MDILVISITALIASGLTLFSGFGLGTLLMPVVAIFFPIEIAVAVTAIVHLSNNLFKLAMLGREANFSVLLRFGATAILFAFAGALVLNWLADLQPLWRYQLSDSIIEVSPVKLIVGVIILVFVYLELSKALKGIQIDQKFLAIGGAISGFFGGLSGHQGAFRSMFLLKAGLTKDAFIATGVTIAVLVDISRLAIYGWDMSIHRDAIDWTLVICASLSAFIGAYIGRRLLQKMTIRSIQVAVSILLVGVSLGLISGLI